MGKNKRAVRIGNGVRSLARSPRGALHSLCSVSQQTFPRPRLVDFGAIPTFRIFIATHMIDISSLPSTQGSGNTGISNFSTAMDDHSNTQRTMHQQIQGLQQQQHQHSGGTEQNHQHLDGSSNFGGSPSANLYQSHQQQQQMQQQMQQQQQNRHSPDLNNQGQSGGYNPNGTNNSLNISNEIKRLQQLHQLSTGGGNPSLLMNSGSSSHDPATAAFLQSMLAADSQQKANLNANNNRFENQLTGGAIISSNTNNAVPAPSSANAPTNNSMPMQLPSNFLNDARLLMAQNQAFQQSQGMPFAMMPQQQPQQQQAIGTNQEMPLPSPHSLFHRDGSRRMRGGVIEPFPGTCTVWAMFRPKQQNPFC